MALQRILIAIDDNKYAEHAAAFGFELARTYKAKVGLVCMVEPAIFPTSPGTDIVMGTQTDPSNVNELEIIKIQGESAENILNKTTKKFAGDLGVTHFMQYGPTGEGIINCSKEFKADLIVVGTHSRTGLDRLLMGSIAEHVIRHSDVPVMVVPLGEN